MCVKNKKKLEVGKEVIPVAVGTGYKYIVKDIFTNSILVYCYNRDKASVVSRTVWEMEDFNKVFSIPETCECCGNTVTK